MRAIVVLTLLMALSPVVVRAQGDSGKGNKPNIVFILMDNLGYGEVGC